MPSYLMAVDAGTGSVRAVLFDLKGNQIECVQHEWTHHEDPRYPGSMDFDWNTNWDLARDCISGVIRKSGINPRDIAAVSTTCMREGIVLYDKAGKEIWACANVDARSNDEVSELLKSYPGLEKELYLESGQSYALDALPRLLWVKNKLPDVYEKIGAVGMFNDWLIYKMTGSLAVEPSNGSTSGLMDLKTRTWDPRIAERVGLRNDIFPEVKESGTIAGKVSAKGAQDTGLAEGTPVVVGGGDSQLGCIGVGVVLPNEAAIFGGSFWQYEFNTGAAVTDPQCRVRVNCHAVRNVWQYEALAFNPGLVMPRPLAALATSTPMAPRPMTPSTLPEISVPAKAFLPFSTSLAIVSVPLIVCTHSMPPTMSRAASSMPHRTSSLTPLALAPGVLKTTMPCSAHLSRGMLLTPAPALAMASSPAGSCSSFIEAERTSTASALFRSATSL